MLRLSLDRLGELYAAVAAKQGLYLPIEKADQVDFARWIRALDEVGYDGPLVIEREVGADRVGDIRLAVGHLKACMERE